MAGLIDGVVGHRDTWARLDRTVARGALPHALCFTGPAGIGKRAVARALAQRLLCVTEGARPCGHCGPCRRVAAGQSESLLEIAPEKNQIKIESAREILSFLSLQKVGAARVILIDGPERMNAQTANACLKIIEEPPPATYFVLITPEASLLMPTLRSRAQVIRFAPPTDAELAAHAPAGDPPAEPWMIQAAAGSFARLASLREPDQVALREVALEFLRDALHARRAGMSKVLSSAKDRERTLTTILFLQRHLRDWSAGDLDLGEDRAPGARVALWRHAHQMETDFHGHVDRTLIFENFFNHARAAGG